MSDPIELSPDGTPLVNNYDNFASRFLFIILALLFYLAPLAIGLKFNEFLSISPLVDFTAGIMGFCSSAVSWLPAFLFGGTVFGKWEFAKAVFRLYTQNDFSIAMGLVFLLAPFSIFLIRTIKRTAVSYFSRSLIFFISLILTILSLANVAEYIGHLYAQDVYIFGCVVMGIVYFAVFMSNSQIRRPKEPTRALPPGTGMGINPGVGAGINPTMNQGQQNPFMNFGGGQKF